MSNEALKIVGQPPLVCGIMTRKEAALHIIGGARNLHSHLSATKDPTVSLTTRAVKEGVPPTYHWELKDAAHDLLRKSEDRSSLIEKIIAATVRSQKRDLIEKVRTVGEELVTNALYHSVRSSDGKDARARQSQLSLNDNEAVKIAYGSTPEGVYIAVEDNGGSLGFNDIAQALQRCYGQAPIIENKEGGAGLGLFMVFEAVTHMKVELNPGKSTRIACWIADPKVYSPKHFSFNFFDGAPLV